MAADPDTVPFSYIGLADDSEELLTSLDSFLKYHRWHMASDARAVLYEARDALEGLQTQALKAAERGLDARDGW